MIEIIRHRSYGRRRDFLPQGGRHLLEDRTPVARFGLAEEAGRRIPGAVFPADQPAPLGRERQPDPDRDPQRTGKVGHSRIGADDQVHGRHQGGRVQAGSRAQVLIVDERGHREPPTQFAELLGAVTALQADELHPLDPGQSSNAESGNERSRSRG